MNLIKLLFIVALFTGFLTACNKVDDLPFYKNGVAPVLSTSETTIAPKIEDSNNVVLTLNWTYPNYATDSNNTKYTIEIDSTGKNFADPFTKVVSGKLSTTFMAKEVNSFLIAKKYEINKPVDLDVKVISSYANNNERIESNVLTIKATPYRVLVNYEFPQALRVAGNFQNWDPASAPKIVDINATPGTNYEGYININNPAAEFKFVKGDNWSAGDLGGAGQGKLGGSDNLTIPDGAGVYLVKANTQNLTWSATKINTWGIIGSATPKSWDASTPMTLNTDGTYSITVDLIGGNELKFRANDDWAINFGDNKSNGPDNVPDYGGDNIAIETSGSYLITLDLTLAGNYSYNIKKM
ncbi:MAG: SusE domain-containing protein [Segetibacter sp.]